MAATAKTRRKADDTDPAATEAATPEAPAPTPAPAARGTDPKVLLVSTYLEAHPDGITGADLRSAAGLEPAMVAKVLDAMEISGAARRLEPADGGEVERWQRVTEVDLATVDVDSVPTECRCHCGDVHRRRVVINVGATRAGNGNGALGVNRDGNPKLGKGDAERMVLKFVTSRPDQTFTYGTIARDLASEHGRNMSTGTTRNAQDKLVAKGILVAASDDPHERRVRLAGDYRDKLSSLSPDIAAAAA